MKTCDVCKRTSEELNSLQDGFISSVTIGTDIQVVRMPRIPTTGPPDEVEDKCSVEGELCNECNVKVNESIAKHLHDTFGLRIRR
jgi:hypothetical protein